MFKPLDDFYEWTGFYRRPGGNDSYYHARVGGTGDVQWNDIDEDGLKFQCPFIMDEAATELISAVNRCKSIYSYNNSNGGGFSINEHGLVIVPISSGGNEFIVPKLIGIWQGRILFEDPYDDDIHLSLDPDNFTTGDDWNLPYLGMKYNLSANNKIYFSFRNEEGQKYISLPDSIDAKYLIKALRQIRPGRVPMTFLVNNNHAVIAKANNGDWTPKFVCKLDINNWYTADQIIQGGN